MAYAPARREPRSYRDSKDPEEMNATELKDFIAKLRKEGFNAAADHWQNRLDFIESWR